MRQLTKEEEQILDELENPSNTGCQTPGTKL